MFKFSNFYWALRYPALMEHIFKGGRWAINKKATCVSFLKTVSTAEKK